MSKRKNKTLSKATSRGTTTQPNSLFRVVLLIFFLSGITGLVYEILWTRMIESITGSSPFAVSIVLTVFMGGLGFGSWIAGRNIDRIDKPNELVKIYGILELAIGLYGIILPFLLILFRPVYVLIYNHLFDMFMAYNILTFIGCSLLLIVPATCMGMTLPILSRFYVTSSTHIGSHLGRLYGINTIGAAIGTLVCGFWIIGAWGIYGALGAAITVNSIIAIVAFKLSSNKRLRTPLKSIDTGISIDRDDTGTTESTKSNKDERAIGYIALTIFAVSGFCSMAYEVIWTKLLGLIVGPTTFSFTIVVSVFIFGLALGSMIFGHIADRLHKNKNSSVALLIILVVTQICAASSVLIISQILGNSQMFFSKLISTYQNTFFWLMFSKIAILFILLSIPTIFLGATFPLVCKLYTHTMSQIGKSVGFAYAINTIGAVIGSFSAGFILIPLIGKEHGISLLVILQLATALLTGSYIVFISKSYVSRFIPFAILAILILGSSLYYPHWNHLMLAEGKYHRLNTIMYSGSDFINTDKYNLNRIGWLESILNWTGKKYDIETGELEYYGDGIGGFTSVIKYKNIFGGDEYSISNSGKADASSWNEDMFTQTLLAHFPMIFHQNPKSVMVLGLASGITAGETLHYPIEQLDIIDINDQVVKASDYFIPWNNNVLSDSRTNLIIQDGRAHIQMTNRMYDVVISEPSNPWMAGLASLFTQDFFTAVNEHLNNGGIFCQWIHSYQIDWNNFSLIGRTFADVFPNSVFVTLRPGDIESDCLLIGIKGNTLLQHANIVDNYKYAQRSTNMSLSDPRVFYSLILSDNLTELFGKGPLNTDSHPRLEYGAPQQMYSDDPMIRQNLLSRRRVSPELASEIRSFNSDVDLQISLLEYMLSFNDELGGIVNLELATPDQRERYYQVVFEYCSNNKVIDFSFISDEIIRNECFEHHITAMQSAAQHSDQPEQLYQYIGTHLDNRGNQHEAIYYFQQAISSNPDFDSPYYSIGKIYAQQGNITGAMENYLLAIDRNPRNIYALNNLGSLFARQARYHEATQYYLMSLQADPNQLITLQNLAQVYQLTGQPDKSAEYKEKADELARSTEFQ